MGKTVTLLSYPLWIHSIQPLFGHARVRARVHHSWPVRVRVQSVHDRERFTRSRGVNSSSGRGITPARDSPTGSILGRLSKARNKFSLFT